jgi:hypothetical protein
MKKIGRKKAGRPPTGVERYTFTMLPSLMAAIRRRTDNVSRWLAAAAREKIEREPEEKPKKKD